MFLREYIFCSTVMVIHLARESIPGTAAFVLTRELIEPELKMTELFNLF